MEEEVVLSILFGCVTYTVVNVARSAQRWRRDQAMAEVTAKLLDRVGSGQDLVNFVNSDAYKNMVGEPQRDGGITSRILNSLQLGFVLFAGGGALAWSAGWAPAENAKAGFAVVGTVLMAVGAALVLSGVLSKWLVSQWNGGPNGNRDA